MSDIPGIEIPFINLPSEQQRDSSPVSKSDEQYARKGENPILMGLRVQRTVENSMGAMRAFASVANKAERYYNGHQWDSYDKMVMEQSRRPVLTFNEIQKVVRGVCGLERLNRTEVRFISRQVDSNPLQDAMGDLATEAVSAVDEMTEAGNERSIGVKDLATGGMGWLEVKMSFEEELDGQITKEHIPWKEMHWDPNARRPGLVDTRWRARKRNMPRDMFYRRWPDKFTTVAAAAPDIGEWTIEKYELVTPYYSLANEKANPQVGEPLATKGTVPVIQFQERYEVDVYRIADPDDPNKLIEMGEKDYNDIKRECQAFGIPPPQSLRQSKLRVRQIYVAHGVLLEDPVDLPGDRFSLLCMTGEWDDELKVFTGVTQSMLDPQNVKNKALSAALAYYLTNAKGGVMFEAGTWQNESLARDQWSSPNAWLQVAEGKLDKVKPRAPIPMPEGLTAFFEIATQSIPRLSGISEELLGMGVGELGNPTQKSRLVGTLAILGWFFDEINRFKREEARVTLDFIKEFATDGQLVQIGGMFNSQAIPLLRENLPKKYELQCDESVKANPNLKAQIWTDLMPIIPALLRFGAGSVLLSLLKFSPLPASVVREIQQAVQAQPPQQQGKGRGKDPEETKAKVQKIGADTQKVLAQARAIDRDADFKTAEILIDALKVGSNAEHQHSERQHKQQIDVVKVLSSFLPGLGQKVNQMGHQGA